MPSIAEYTCRDIDPLEFARHFWPDSYFYDKQREMIYSVERNVETYVKSANQMGKDFTAGFVALKQFLCNPVARVLGTSIKDDHLIVLEGEINRWIATSRFPLRVENGGPLVVNYHNIRKVVFGERCPISYLRLMVSEKGEGLAGHHAPYTLAIGDEASGLDNACKTFMEGWGKRFLWFGNPHHTENFFRRGCDGGDVWADDGESLMRKVITFKATDSPNVRRGMALEKLGLPPEPPVLPGVLTYEEYKFRRRMWDAVRQCVGLDADFYMGAELLLYPPEWLASANLAARECPVGRTARAIGVDPAEGGDSTCLAAVDEFGLVELLSLKTPNTAVIMGHVLAFANKWGCPYAQICFDRGGGGKQVADRMRDAGYPVSTVDFSEPVNLELKRVRYPTETRRENREDRTTYKSRRQEMYAILSDAIDPSRLLDLNGNPTGGRIFAIPGPERGSQYSELLRQMRAIPKKYDQDGRLSIPPKRRKDTIGNTLNRQKSLEELIGCSPDELDALAIAYWKMMNRSIVPTAGAV